MCEEISEVTINMAGKLMLKCNKAGGTMQTVPYDRLNLYMIILI